MIEAIILAGGRGTRLAGVLANVPKPLAPVAGRPFLDYLLERLAASGLVAGVTLALGHLAERVVEYYRQHPAPLPLSFLVEDRPLGTAGAIRHALPEAPGERVLAANGDSIFPFDLEALIACHAESAAAVTLALVRLKETGRYGQVCLDGGRVTGFVEKDANAGPGLINAGLYALRRDALAEFGEDPLSLEYDVLPVLAERGEVAAVIMPGPFIDIGLPESYAAAADVIAAIGTSP